MRGEKQASPHHFFAALGSPPRARGEVVQQKQAVQRVRITPACAGRRVTELLFAHTDLDHPRVRGEKRRGWSCCTRMRGSPPRARGEARCAEQPQIQQRITPACAGRSAMSAVWSLCRPDHPRVRGEKPTPCASRTSCTGSPPRARGEACRSSGCRPCLLDHPRVRGEKADRGRLPVSGRRITPACAGRRRPSRKKPPRRRDHPRVRGEKSNSERNFEKRGGSPPRARGEEAEKNERPVAEGITPACAGRRLPCCHRRALPRDHPRVRGEKPHSGQRRGLRQGSPPRARGEAVKNTMAIPCNRITPACAGRRLKKSPI